MPDENQPPTVPLPPTLLHAALTPPTVEAAVWAESALASARGLKAALNRLTIDHLRELTLLQTRELAAARNHAEATKGILRLLAQQLRQATTPPAPAGVYLHVLPREETGDELDPDAWTAAMLAPDPPDPEPTAEQLEAAEAQADQDYDAWRNR